MGSLTPQFAIGASPIANRFKHRFLSRSPLKRGERNETNHSRSDRELDREWIANWQRATERGPAAAEALSRSRCAIARKAAADG